MRVSDIKTDCKLRKDGQTVEGFIHLIEIAYSDWIVFWNGVIQMTRDALGVVGRLGSDSRPIEVFLPDGRTGYLRISHFRAQGDDYYEVAGTGKPNETSHPKKPHNKPDLQGNRSVLKFNLIVESVNMGLSDNTKPWGILNTLNRTEWMGKEPSSCQVIHFEQKEPVPVGKTATMDHAEFLVYVGYRPEGWISQVKNNGRDRLNGWHLEIRDQKNDGTLLDGRGNPLPPGAEPIFRRFRHHELTDFNECDFGEFLGEE